MTASQRAYGGRRTAQGGEVDASTVIARSMSEKALSDHIVNLARMLGWLVHRDPTWRATGTDAGYPDLTLAKDGQVIFVELKAEGGRMSVAQHEWARHIDGAYHGSAAAYPGRPWYYVWLPRHWLSGVIERVLRGEG